MALERRKEQVDQRIAVTAAASGHQHEFFITSDAKIPARCSDVFRRRDFARDITGEIHLRGNVGRNGIFPHRIVKVAAAVDPDLPIELVHGVIDALVAPVLHRRGGPVHDVAQPQDGSAGRAVGFEPMEGIHHIALQPQRGLIDDEEVGLECHGRSQNNFFSDFQHFRRFKFHGKRQVLFVGDLDHSRNAHKIDPHRAFEAAGQEGAGDDQDVGRAFPEAERHGQTSPDMSQTVGVMRVHQNLVGNDATQLCFFRETPSRDFGFPLTGACLHHERRTEKMNGP